MFWINKVIEHLLHFWTGRDVNDCYKWWILHVNISCKTRCRGVFYKYCHQIPLWYLLIGWVRHLLATIWPWQWAIEVTNSFFITFIASCPINVIAWLSIRDIKVHVFFKEIRNYVRIDGKIHLPSSFPRRGFHSLMNIQMSCFVSRWHETIDLLVLCVVAQSQCHCVLQSMSQVQCFWYTVQFCIFHIQVDK